MDTTFTYDAVLLGCRGNDHPTGLTDHVNHCYLLCGAGDSLDIETIASQLTNLLGKFQYWRFFVFSHTLTQPTKTRDERVASQERPLFMRFLALYLVMICSTIVVLLYAISIDSSSVEADVTLGLATTTCPMAHCNQRQQDLIHVIPIATPIEAWHFGELGNSDGEPVVGVLWALGATIGDGFVVVSVIYSATTSPLDTPAYVYALDLKNGERIWSSADFAASKTLDLSVANGAPLIASDGSIYVADDHITVKFFKNNSGEWTAASSSHNGLSSPFSFNITHEGDLVAADDEGHVWLTDPDDLSVIASTTLTGCCFGTPRWITRNTTAVAGSRVYIVTTLKNLNIPRQKCIRPFFCTK